MRVRISANPPLPPVKAWFPLHLESIHSTPTISSFKATLCTSESLPAFRGLSPCSLHLSIDGFELLDNSELSIVRDGDLICVDVLDVTARDHLGNAVAQAASQATQKRLEPEASRKRKRRMSSSSSSSSESEPETETETESESEDSESESDSDDSLRPTTLSLRKAQPPKAHVRATPSVQPKPHVVHPSTFVPPGYGKPQTRTRNLRRRLKRIHEHEASGVSEGGPVSGVNAVVPGKNGQMPAVPSGASRDVHNIPALLSLSLRNKNKAKNFKSLIGRPLPPKIIFGDQEGDASACTSGATGTPKSQVLPRLIPPSSRSSLPPNVFVTSIDVEAGLRRGKRKSKMRIEYGDELEGGTGGEAGDVSLGVDTTESEVDVDKLESIADKQWATLEKPTRETQVKPGMIVGYKGLGINPVTYTPEQLLTVGSVVSCESKTVVVRPLRGVSFSGPVDEGAEEERHTWDEIEHGDWRIIQ